MEIHLSRGNSALLRDATLINQASSWSIDNPVGSRRDSGLFDIWLGLITSGGRLTWLLDNHYGAGAGAGAGEASGVGIRIYMGSGSVLNLLPDLTSYGTGNPRGWYAFRDLTTLVSSGNTDIYTGSFTASLEALGQQPVTPGTVNAQLQIMVSFQ